MTFFCAFTLAGRRGVMPPQHRTPVALPVTLPDALVVDADEDIRLALRTLLEDAGYRVSDATTWQEARRYPRSHPGALVILLDVSMPRPRDVLLQRVLRSATHTRRHGLVLLSTQPTSAGALGHALGVALALGVPIVPKPFNIDDLLAAVTSAARRVQIRWGSPYGIWTRSRLLASRRA